LTQVKYRPERSAAPSAISIAGLFSMKKAT
jgi:hypothetical protein